MNESILSIGTRRECFFDTCLLDEEKTTASFRLHEPVLKGTVLMHDEPWEGNGCDYHNLFFDPTWPGVDGSHPEGVYRMYYNGFQAANGSPNNLPDHPLSICYAESTDGIHWIKPSLGVREWNGSLENNIVIDSNDNDHLDNFMVFRDTNPDCPPEERYKGVSSRGENKDTVLGCWFSEDGIRFRFGRVITEKGFFDTLNVIFWDEISHVYRGYIRGFHGMNGDWWDNAAIRDIRYIESEDFVTWSDPVLLDFGDAEDYPLYTNLVQPYCRAPHLLIGFPTRYVERAEWNGSFEELGGREARRQRMTLHPRFGLAITDCVFMCSRDGRRFYRHEPAFMRPAMENGLNWVYGDCYPARGFVETPSDVIGAPPELSMYVPANHWMDIPAVLNRYTIRLDGFASMHADDREVLVVTKPFTYEGTNLYVNFSTAARGYLYVALHCGDSVYESCETFGNTVDRRIVFDSAAVADCSGREVTLEIRMKDADLYALRFGK